jgi:hypothetical protein
VRGSPIRTSSDQRSVGSSPRLIAASYVLHRLLVPRHPPCALNNLATQKTAHRPRKETICAALHKLLLQSQKMLASTVQFSTYNRPPTPPPPPNPAPTGGTSGTRTGRPRHKKPPPARQPRAGPLPQDPTACLRPPPPPIPFPTHPKARRTGDRQTPAAELVSVPPSSTTPNTRGPPDRAAVTIRARLWTTTTTGRPVLLRKEVIQPHLPVRLPCYDFVPIADPAFDGSLPQGVGPPASGVTDFRDVTGGVYKARERIHRSVADLRLLATPTSWGRVADPNPN